MSKSFNKKVFTDEGIFESKREYARWCDLKLLQRAGKIHDLRRQVRFRLCDTEYDEDGIAIIQYADYIADFVYVNDKGETIVEDTKGFKTKDYIIKRKLMLYVHGIRIQEI